MGTGLSTGKPGSSGQRFPPPTILPAQPPRVLRPPPPAPCAAPGVFRHLGAAMVQSIVSDPVVGEIYRGVKVTQIFPFGALVEVGPPLWPAAGISGCNGAGREGLPWGKTCIGLPGSACTASPHARLRAGSAALEAAASQALAAGGRQRSHELASQRLEWIAGQP